MEQEKDYSLLRPFDLEAAKEWAAIDDTFGGMVVFVDGPDAGGKYAVLIDGHFAAVLGENLRMAPLCWVEGRPVYKGDVLWHRRRGRIVASHMIDDGEFLCEEGEDSGDRIENLTWTPPKVKREGWVNIYPLLVEEHVASVSHAYVSKKSADRNASPGRIACVRIEWEE